MNYFNKKNIFLWAFIILLVFNISGLITFYVHVNNFKKDNTEFRFHERPNPRCFIQEELNLSDEQLSNFDELRKTQIRNSKYSRNIIFEENKVLYDEITNENPDLNVIDSLLEDMGKLHIQLYQNNINHYNELKMLCDDKQIEKLNEFYKEIMFQQKKGHTRHNYKQNRINRKYHK